MAEVLFVVQKETHQVDGKTCRWMYVNSCPHGKDIGAIELSDTSFDCPIEGSDRRRQIWEWHDLGNGRCTISPSLLVPKLHNNETTDCHFGPGEFNFVWLEINQLRDSITGLPGTEYMKSEA